MSCPKVNPRYPVASQPVERPYLAMVRQADPDFDKNHRYDKAYEFGKRRVFTTDSILSGAYVPVTQATLEAQFRFDNGFCDPADNGLVFTGTGAGGRNPGSVPSRQPWLMNEDGSYVLNEDGSHIEIEPAVPTGVVIGPTS